MAKSKFAAARANVKRSNAERILQKASADVSADTEYEMQRLAYANRYVPDSDGAAQVQSKRNRDELFTRNYRWVDVREIHASPKNHFNIDREELEGLKTLILSHGMTTPIVVREVLDEEGEVVMELVDGERRTIAHKELGEEIDEMWFAIMARYYPIGTLSDGDAELLLNSLNLGQRNKSQSEIVTAFAAVADTLVQQKLDGDPKASESTIKETLAKQFKCSPRSAAMNVNIGRHLTDFGMRLLDEGKITKTAADAIATLPEEAQLELLHEINDGVVQKADAESVARELSPKRKAQETRGPATLDGYVASAVRSLKRAQKLGGHAQRRDIAALRDLIDEIDPDLESKAG